MNELALFAGAGGGLLATKWLCGWKTICYVEQDKYAVEIIKARIKDGLLDDAPIWGDIETFNGKPWCGCVDIITAGFPCQPFSKSGKRNGIEDARNKWPDTIRIISEVNPTWVFLENSSILLSPFRKRGLPAYFNTILRDLASIGYDARWGCLSAATFGAIHKRKRLWIVAHPSGQGRPFILCGNEKNSLKTDRCHSIRKKIRETNSLDAIFSYISQLEESLGEPSVCGVDDGLAHRVDRLRAIGNGQVPIVAENAWKILSGENL